MSDFEPVQATRQRTARWAWVVVLGVPLVALVLMIYGRLVRPEFDTSSSMQIDKEWMVSFLPVPFEDHIGRLGAPNFADCDGDGLPEIGFRSVIHYSGIFEEKWDFLNAASAKREMAWRAYSILTGEEVLHVPSTEEESERRVRPDGTICLHPVGTEGEVACSASKPCGGGSFPPYWDFPWQVQVEDRQYTYDRFAENGESWFKDLATGRPVFSEAQYSQRSSSSNFFGEVRLLRSGLILEFEASDNGSNSHAQIFRFHPSPAVQKYLLPEHCVQMWNGLSGAGVVELDPDGSLVFLAGIELPKPDEQGEPVLPFMSQLVEVRLGEDAVVRTIFDDFADDPNELAQGNFSAAVRCRGSAFYIHPMEEEATRRTSGFRVRTPWLRSSVMLTLPSWVPESRMAASWARVLPDLDGDGSEECLVVWRARAFPEDGGLVALVISGATGQLVRRDAVRRSLTTSE